MRTNPQNLNERIRLFVVQWRTEQGLTHDQLAARFRTVGLDMSRSALTAFERSGRKFDIGEFVLLCIALNTTPFAVLRGDESVGLSTSATAPLGKLRDLLAKPSGVLTWGDVEGFEPATGNRREQLERSAAQEAARQAAEFARLPGARWVEAEQAAGLEAEVRAAQRLGISPHEVATNAFLLWGRSLTAERDYRAEGRLNPTTPERSARMIRAHVTRQLEAELRDSIEGAN
jgi:transcriptional regulator with XRE-family HTH domain